MHQPTQSQRQIHTTASLQTSDHPDYPRKQMRRSHWLSLNGEWDFAFDDAQAFRHPDELEQWPKKIVVPYAPESEASGIADQGFHPSCWYKRTFHLERPPGGADGARVLLRFGAVDYKAQVWVNGLLAGCHEGGHTPFVFDITDMMGDADEHTIVVWAHDDPQDLAKPRGKQDWQLNPHSIWYPRTTGIWQSVWLEVVPRIYMDRIRWTPHLERWEIGCEIFLNGEVTDDMRLRVRLRVGDKILADDVYAVVQGEVHRRIALSDPGIDDYRNELLWSPEKPTLIQAEVQLIKDGQVIDDVRSYTALRGVAIQRGRFILNNRPYFLRLVLDQGYWPETLMTPPSQDAIKLDIELVKRAGFNGVRKHQKIEDPDFLYWADVMGLLVWEEMPSAYRFTNESVRRLIKEWVEVIDRDSNHPCIITWVPFNESWGVPNLPDLESHQSCVQALYHLTRTLDPSRPVIGNDGWESTATDIIGIHDYDDDPARILKRYGEDVSLQDLLWKDMPGGRMLTLEGHPHKGQPLMLTEFGGIAYRDPSRHAQSATWGYSVGTSSKDLQRRYEGLLEVVNRVEVFSGFCYTQFTDTFQEANGLFFADRTPKFSLESMKEATLGKRHPPSEVPTHELARDQTPAV